jgi:hypothetical protein
MLDRLSARLREPHRRVLAVALLVILAVSLARFERRGEAARRWSLLARSLDGQPPSPAQGTRFWFDPDYAVFLDALEGRLPADASVAVLAPPWPDAYRYLAVYRLAPRRVVEARWMDEARAVAVYRTEAGRGPRGAPIANGTLWMR